MRDNNELKIPSSTEGQPVSVAGKPEWRRPVTTPLSVDENTSNTHGGDSSETYSVYQS